MSLYCATKAYVTNIQFDKIELFDEIEIPYIAWYFTKRPNISKLSQMYKVKHFDEIQVPFIAGHFHQETKTRKKKMTAGFFKNPFVLSTETTSGRR